MRILVGYVRTELGQAVLRQAIDETRLRGGELLVLNTLRGGGSVEPEEAEAYRREFEELDRSLTDQGVDHRMLEYTVGDSLAEDLLAAARKNEVDLLVIGLRRRSPVGKLVMGSTAQEILLNADCPVLAVKLPPEQA
jgi:nucleotide-binding universal stress UspA family protein